MPIEPDMQWANKVIDWRAIRDPSGLKTIEPVGLHPRMTRP
jgi:hypothetical protein